MKRIAFIVFLAMLLAAGCFENKQEQQIENEGKKQYARISLNNLRQIDVRDYYGMTVDSFIRLWDFTYQSYYWGDEPPGYLSNCCFECNDSVKIYITIDSAKYQPRFSPNLSWDITKFMRETILVIGIHINRKPLHGGYFLGPPPKDAKVIKVE